MQHGPTVREHVFVLGSRSEPYRAFEYRFLVRQRVVDFSNYSKLYDSVYSTRLGKGTMTCPFVTDWNIPQICIWEIIAFYGGTALCQQCLFLPVNLISWTVNNSYSDIAASSDSFPILDSFPRRWLLEWRQFLDRARSQTGYFLLMLIFSLSWLFIMVIKTNTFLNILIYLLYIFSVHCSPLCSSLLKQFFFSGANLSKNKHSVCLF